MTPATKLPSKTIADFGVLANTLETELGKSVCKAVPGSPMSVLLPISSFIVVNALTTELSVHGIACVLSLS